MMTRLARLNSRVADCLARRAQARQSRDTGEEERLGRELCEIRGQSYSVRVALGLSGLGLHVADHEEVKSSPSGSGLFGLHANLAGRVRDSTARSVASQSVAGDAPLEERVAGFGPGLLDARDW